MYSTKIPVVHSNNQCIIDNNKNFMYTSKKKFFLQKSRGSRDDETIKSTDDDETIKNTETRIDDEGIRKQECTTTYM